MKKTRVLAAMAAGVIALTSASSSYAAQTTYTDAGDLTDGIEFTLFQLEIIDGALDVELVDTTGTASAAPVTSPIIDFGTVAFAFVDTTISGTLGDPAATSPGIAHKVRLSNPRTTATWDINISAVDTEWSDGGSETIAHDDDTGGIQLEVDPSGATVVDINGGGITGITFGAATKFAAAVTSITMVSAGGTAAAYEQFDITGIALTQDIPAGQASGTYTIEMQLTAI